MDIKDLLKKFKKSQEKLRKEIIIRKFKGEIKIIAGCDSSLIGPRFKADKILSVFVLFKYPSLEEIEVKYHISKLDLPYIPGFLSYREMPNLIKAFRKLKNKPDIIIVDGQGIMHPRRLGLATHLGLKLNIPTFGVAKKKLFGQYENPGKEKGQFSYVYEKQEVLGVALRSKTNVKPIFISPGHLCDLETVLSLTLKTIGKYKLPEPTRIADSYSKSLKNRDILKY